MNEEIIKQATELVLKFMPFTRYDVQNDFKNRGYSFAKQCALIDTENTINMLNNVLYYDNEDSDLTNHIVAKLHQQQAIKQAIENL